MGMKIRCSRWNRRKLWGNSKRPAHL